LNANTDDVWDKAGSNFQVDCLHDFRYNDELQQSNSRHKLRIPFYDSPNKFYDMKYCCQIIGKSKL